MTYAPYVQIFMSSGIYLPGSCRAAHDECKIACACSTRLARHADEIAPLPLQARQSEITTYKSMGLNKLVGFYLCRLTKALSMLVLS